MTARLPDISPPIPVLDAPDNDDFSVTFEQAIAERIGEQRCRLWFHGHTRFRLESDLLTVGVPNLHYQEWLSNKFIDAVRSAAAEVIDRPVEVRFRILPELFRAGRAAQEAVAGTVSSQPAPKLNGTPTAETPPAPPKIEAAKPRNRGLFDEIDKLRAERKERMSRRHWRRLGEFVVGSCNRVAFAAATSVVEEAGQGPNPLVVHGPVGTGKTHLLEGIFAGLKRRDANLQVTYVTAEDFTNRFVAAMRFGKQPAFRQRFRSCDVLLLDDLHFLAKKRATQEEFLHTCDALLDDGRQLVVSCDSHPRTNDDFLPELLDRLLGGAIWGLQPPDSATRLELLRAKANGTIRETRRRADKEITRQPIPDDVLCFVAEKLRGNVRELEGAANSLRHYSLVMNRPVDIALAREALGDLLRHAVRVVRVADVDAAVCAALRLAPGTLQSQERSWSVSHPRMLAISLCRKHTVASYGEISKHFGSRSHSNAVAAEKKVRDWLHANQNIAAGGREWAVRDLLERIERELLK